MSQRCPHCRLYNPDAAERCDCGYDFGTGSVRASYLAAYTERKHGGRSNMLLSAARENIRYGALITILVVGLSVAAAVATGEVKVVVPFGLIWGVVLLRRGLRQRREAAASSKTTL